MTRVRSSKLFTKRRAKQAGIGLAAVLALAVAADQTTFRGHADRPAHVAKASQLFVPAAARADAPRGVALLVNGGYTVGKNHRRYWNNLSLMYRTLETLGWRRVRALDADGQAGVPDRNRRSILGVQSDGVLEDSPLDLDGDGAADVAGPGTRAALERELAALGADVKPGEEVFLFLTDHGQLRVKDGHVRAVALFWNEELAGTELDAMLRRSLPADAHLTVLAAQCHSARFLEEVQRPHTTMMASGAPLWIWSDQDYSVFPYWFSAALLGRDPETLAPVSAATSLDGAFDTASARDHTPEWPRRWNLP